MFELSELERLFKAKPDITNISSVKKLKKFIEDYPNDTLKPGLRVLSDSYQHYRAVNGDGNCFYRSIMFLYLREADLSNYQTLFPPTNLLQCKKLPIQISNTITSQNLVYYIWQRLLLPLTSSSPQKRQQQLEKLINNSDAFDTILIAYFRVRNYEFLKINRLQIQPFTAGGIQSDLERVMIFGEESEGVQIFTLSKILNRTIEIMAVNETGVKPVVYNGYAEEGRVYRLFYRPGHYDIISEPQQYQRQSSSSQYQKPQFSSFLKQNTAQVRSHYQPPKYQSTTSHKGSNLIFVDQPEQIRLVDQPKLKIKFDDSASNIKTFSQVKKELNSKVTSNQKKLTQPKKDISNKVIQNDKSQQIKNSSNDQLEKQNKEKKQADKKHQQTRKTTKIASHADKTNEAQKKQLIGQAVFCVAMIAVFGFAILKSF